MPGCTDHRVVAADNYHSPAADKGFEHTVGMHHIVDIVGQAETEQRQAGTA